MKTRARLGIVFGILWLTAAPVQSRVQTPADADTSFSVPRSLDFNLINGSFVSWSTGSSGRLQMRYCLEPTFVHSNRHEKADSKEDRNSGTDALVTLSAVPLFRMSSGRTIQTYAGCGPVLSYHGYRSTYYFGSNEESIRLQTFHQTEWGAGIRAVAGLRIPLPRKITLFSEYHLTVLRGWGNELRTVGHDRNNDNRLQTHSWNVKFSPLRFGLSIAI
jgi:hypothetical protein